MSITVFTTYNHPREPFCTISSFEVETDTTVNRIWELVKEDLKRVIVNGPSDSRVELVGIDLDVGDCLEAFQ